MKKPHTIATELSALIKGRVADPFDPDYRNAVQIDNGRIAHEPILVVIPDDADDVVAIVKYCADPENRKHIHLTAKSGGHSAAGYCLNTGGVVLDLRRLNRISFDVNKALLTVGAGCRWRQVYDYLETYGEGYVPVGGGCPTVGVSGFLLGGGYSFLSRSYGLGCDKIQSFKIVTADGQLLTIRRDTPDVHEKDLFWACCGGGGGNFGIAVEFELIAEKPDFETLLVGEIAFPFYRIDEVLEVYNKKVEKLNNRMAVYGRIANVTDQRTGKRMLTLLFTPVYNGPFSEGIKELDFLLKLCPVRTEFHNMTIHEWEDYIGSRTTIAGRSAYIRSLIFPAKSLDQHFVDTMKEHMARCPSQDTFIVWTHAGGAIEDVGEEDTAFYHRKARFIPEIKAIWDSSKPEETRLNVEWAHKFFEELAGKNAVGAYLNYIDPLLNGWATKYHGKNYPRLKSVKKHWDKSNLFHFNQGIGSTFDPETEYPLDLMPLLKT